MADGAEELAAKVTRNPPRNKSKRKIREREGKFGREYIVSEKSPPELKKGNASAEAAAAMTTIVVGTSSLIKETKKDKKMRKEMLEKVEERVMDEEQDVDLVGKKYDTPDERDPLKIFLEVLYQQLPNDELVASWMMEYGLLPFNEANKVHGSILNKDLCKTLKEPVSDKCLEKPVPKRLSKTKKHNRHEDSLAESSVPKTRIEKTKKTSFSS